MYSYKQIADSNNINMIKKTYGKFLIPIIFTMVSIVNIILILLFYLATKNLFLESSYLIYILPALIVLQIILGVTIYGKYINKVANGEGKKHMKKLRLILMKRDLILRRLNTLIEICMQKAVKEVGLFDRYIMFVSKISCVLSYIMTFDGFNVEKDVLISDIEKYKEVRWYYNEF